MTSSRLLASQGHPGYGEAFAARILAAQTATGKSLHELVYTALRYNPSGK